MCEFYDALCDHLIDHALFELPCRWARSIRRTVDWTYFVLFELYTVLSLLHAIQLSVLHCLELGQNFDYFFRI